MCSHGMGTLSTGSGTWGHDGRSGGKESAKSQTPRRLHRQTQEAWERGPALQRAWEGKRGTRREDVQAMKVAPGGMPRSQCVRERGGVQASAGLTCGWEAEEEVDGQCSAAPSRQRRTPGGGASGWRRWRRSGWPARYVPSRSGQRGCGARSSSPLLPLTAAGRQQRRRRSVVGGCEGRRCRRGSVALPGGCYYSKKMNTTVTHLPTESTQCKNISTPTQWNDGTFRFNHRFGGGMQCSLLFYITAVL